MATKEKGILVNGQRQLTIPKPKQQKVSKKERDAAKSTVQNLLRDRFIRSFFGMPGTDELIEGNNYVIGSDGLYMVRKNRVGLFTTMIAENRDHIRIPLVENGKQPVEGFTMTLENKIPYNMLLQIVAFFRRVFIEKNGAEAVVQIFYNPEEKEFYLHIGEQGVSGGGATMDRDAKLEVDHVLVADFHSHNSMGAFFSGTDNRDEKEARVYGVMGKFQNQWPEMKFRAGTGNGDWLELSPFDVFETPDVGVVEVPDEWMKKVNTHSAYAKRSHYERPDRHGVIERFSPTDGYGHRTRGPVFGRAGSVNQDILDFPVADWERDIGWEGGPEDLFGEDYRQYFDRDSVGPAIESLIENSEVLDSESAKAMWLSLIERLDPESKDLLRRVIDESRS